MQEALSRLLAGFSAGQTWQATGGCLGRENFFQTGWAARHDKQNLIDFEQRLSMYYRDISRALPELGNTTYVPSEIYGWFLLKKHVRLDLSDLATLKSQAKWYKLESVLSALRTMWGGESLEERRRASKAHMVGQYDNEGAGDGGGGGAIWWNEHEDDTEDGERGVVRGGATSAPRQPRGRGDPCELPGGKESLLQGRVQSPGSESCEPWLLSEQRG